MAHPDILGLNKSIKYTAVENGYHASNNLWGDAALVLSDVGVPVQNPGERVMFIRFQDGPVQEIGVNGVGIENVLEVCRVRLQMHQAGKHACRENAIAITKIEEALLWLGARTALRQEQGVEGTDKAHKSG